MEQISKWQISFSLGKGLVGLGKDGGQAILMADQSSKKKYVLERISHTFLAVNLRNLDLYWNRKNKMIYREESLRLKKLYNLVAKRERTKRG